MTIQSTVSAQTFLGDGVQRDFPFSFRGWEGEMLVLTADPDEVETDVTEQAAITFNDETVGTAGGVVRYPASVDTPALPAGWRITVLRRMDFLQNTVLTTPRRFDGAVITERLDRLTAQDQELREELRRAIKIAISSPGSPPTAEELYAEVERIAEQARQAAAQAEDAVTRAGQAVTEAESAVDTAEAASAGADAARLAAQASAAEASAAMSKLLGMEVVVEFVGSDTPPSGSYDPDTGVLTIKIPAAPGGGGSIVLSDKLDGTNKAADGVGASEWALAQVNNTAHAAGTLAATAKARADEAYSLADSIDVPDIPDFPTPTPADKGKALVVGDAGAFEFASVATPEELAVVAASIADKLDTARFETIPFKNVWVSGEYQQNEVSPFIINVTHNLNLVDPQKAYAHALFVCKVAEFGYAVGETAPFVPYEGGIQDSRVHLGQNSLRYQGAWGSTGKHRVTNRTTGQLVVATSANWRLVFRVWY